MVYVWYEPDYIDRPKAESAIRVIPMPSLIMELFEECSDSTKYRYFNGNTSIFRAEDMPDQYKKVLEEAGLCPYTFRALRHTFTARCVESGFDPKSL